MKTRIGVLIIFIVAGLSGQAQIETILWQNCFGTLNGRNWTKAVERSTNGYLFGIDLGQDGPGVSNFHGIDDAWIVNTDFEGNLLWEK